MKQLELWLAFGLISAISAMGQSKTPRPSAPTATPSAASASQTDQPTFSRRYPRYELHAGDQFDLSFEFTPEMNQTVTVQPDGYISLKEVGDMYVSGLTLPELQDHVKAAYSHILAHPVVSVLPKDLEKPYFTATGQVNKPGKYDLRGDTTVVQAIAEAGGFDRDAKHSQVVLFRRINDNWVEAKLIDVKKMLRERNLSEDLHLQPGDMLFVPKNRISKIMQFLPSTNMSMLTRTY